MVIRLLIVDPDRTLLDCYCAFFAYVGLETTKATSGRSASDVFRANAHDVVMLEPDLPDNGSHLLLSTIATKTERRPLPVIIVSRRLSFELEHPVHAYHVKPVSMRKLLEGVFDISGRGRNGVHGNPAGHTSD